jgi:IclR family transcriptional regulator, KDG regulon repressor
METTIVKGLKVLEVLVQSGGPRSLTDIALQCGISKSNAHRVLGTLEVCGYVTRPAGSRNYELTLRLWEMGQRVFSRVDIRSVAMPHLRTLAAETGETVHLSVLDNNQTLYIDKVDSTHAVRAYVNIGDRAPAYCSATGKAMLAYAPEDAVAAAGANMQRFTSHTVSSAAMLRRQLAAIREQGYSMTNGEWREGVLGFGRAILSPSARAIAAIGVAGPEERMRQGGVEKYVSALLAAGEAIESALGFRNAPIGQEAAPAATPKAPPRQSKHRG